MSPEEVRLRILETAMRFNPTAGPDGVVTICKTFEAYVLGSDKDFASPDDDAKERRSRKAKIA